MKLTAQQRAFAETDETLCAFIGGRQSGKSTAIMHRAAHLHSKHPSSDSLLIITPKIDMERKLTMRLTNGIPEVASTSRISVIGSLNVRDCASLIRAKEHVLLDEYHLLDITNVDRMLTKTGKTKTLSISLTPRTRNLSIPNSYTIFSAPTSSNPAVDPKDLKRINENLESHFPIDVKEFSGHHIIDKDGKINCVLCGESTNYDEENALDRVLSYGLFQDCDCM